MDLTTDTATDLRLMDAAAPETASSAGPSSPTALAQMSPAPAPLHAPQQEVDATETPTQSNASRMHQSVTNYLNRAYPQAPADAITAIAKTLLQVTATPPARVEIQATTAHFEVRAERPSSDAMSTLRTVIIRGIRIRCPSLTVASEVDNALLVEAARPEFLPKFVHEYGTEPRPPPDPTVQRARSIEPAGGQEIVAVQVRAQPPADWAPLRC